LALCKREEKKKKEGGGEEREKGSRLPLPSFPFCSLRLNEGGGGGEELKEEKGGEGEVKGALIFYHPWCRRYSAAFLLHGGCKGKKRGEFEGEKKRRSTLLTSITTLLYHILLQEVGKRRGGNCGGKGGGGKESGSIALEHFPFASNCRPMRGVTFQEEKRKKRGGGGKKVRPWLPVLTRTPRLSSSD